MIRNYILLAFRFLLKNKVYTLLNTLGLSIGLACFIMIMFWVKQELSFDQFHSKADRIYRVAGKFYSESDQMQQAVTPTPLRHALVADMPEVEAAVILDNNDAIVQRGDKQFMEDFLIMTDPSFFDIFSFKLITGDSKTSLNDPYSIVLSRSMARKYFGEEDPIGKSITIFLQDPEGKGKEYKVTGVIEDCPENSHFYYQALISFSTADVNNPDLGHVYEWFNNGYYTYILLREGSSPESLEAKFPQFIDKYMGENSREWKISYEYFLQPITDIHLKSALRYEIRATGNKNNVILFAAVGFIVLLLACINYINLSTAFAGNRFKEVGMRKVMGAKRIQLIIQQLSETCLLALCALLFALIWIELSRPFFESITGETIDSIYSWQAILLLTIIALVVGLFSGAYPALILSGIRPVRIMQGQLRSGVIGAIIRKTLVVVQYTVTIMLVIGIFVAHNQLSFMKDHELGYNKNGLLISSVNGSNEVIQGYQAFANELQSMSMVQAVSRSNTTLAGGLSNSVAEMEDVHGTRVSATMHRARVDFDFLRTYQMELVAGRFFDARNSADSLYSFVVNEATQRFFGYASPNDIVGKDFQFQGRTGKVIGVVRDFHYNSLKHKVDPTCLYLLNAYFSQISIRIANNNFEARDKIEKVWKKHFPNTLFDARFAEEALNNQYDAEKRFASIFSIFSVISLLIASLGLFALVSYSVESRVKEVAVRKVLGASRILIVMMFSKEFLVLIVISLAVALPSGYMIMQNWLAGFEYRVKLSPELFAQAGLVVIIIASLTIGARSLQAASNNPVDSLRNE